MKNRFKINDSVTFTIDEHVKVLWCSITSYKVEETRVRYDILTSNNIKLYDIDEAYLSGTGSDIDTTELL